MLPTTLRLGGLGEERGGEGRGGEGRGGEGRGGEGRGGKKRGRGGEGRGGEGRGGEGGRGEGRGGEGVEGRGGEQTTVLLAHVQVKLVSESDYCYSRAFQQTRNLKIDHMTLIKSINAHVGVHYLDISLNNTLDTSSQ